MSFLRTPPGADPITVEAHLPVPPARVFTAWTDPDIVMQWFGAQPGALADATIELRPGGRWRFTETKRGQEWTGFEGEYLKIVDDELLVFTWTKTTASRTGKSHTSPTSQVEIGFAAARNGTDLTITHSNLDPDSRIGFRIGWETGMGNLVDLLR